MGFETILVGRRDDGICVLTLSRPEKRNAISLLMRQEILACLHDWETSPGVRAVILCGAGGTFSAGFDLQEFQQHDRAQEVFESSAAYHRAVWKFPKPVIAAIQGHALGGGLDLAVLCDVRICSDAAVFGHPEIKFGAPPLFTPLRWIIGDGRARDLCLTGRKITAQEAYRIGLVSEVVSEDLLMERALAIGTSIVQAPAETVEYTKGFFTGNTDKGFEESFQIEHDRAFRDFLLKRRT